MSVRNIAVFFRALSTKKSLPLGKNHEPHTKNLGTRGKAVALGDARLVVGNAHSHQLNKGLLDGFPPPGQNSRASDLRSIPLFAWEKASPSGIAATTPWIARFLSSRSSTSAIACTLRSRILNPSPGLDGLVNVLASHGLQIDPLSAHICPQRNSAIVVRCQVNRHYPAAALAVACLAWCSLSGAMSLFSLKAFLKDLLGRYAFAFARLAVDTGGGSGIGLPFESRPRSAVSHDCFSQIHGGCFHLPEPRNKASKDSGPYKMEWAPRAVKIVTAAWG
ncbi:hypothetical protein MHUMG1_05109 [Metarhizium humberi]|uniref:Uncharacterized protein n=1 Tax=Metarhizium humberi TaxID=2596975 RepID=A0A9P8M8R7_9HYPO|nr:hypothetical protein MHUMG1_05109 [Metarhizium humberi]